MSGGVTGVCCPGESWGIRSALCESSAYIRHSFFDNYTNCVAELKRDADKSENTRKGIRERSGNNLPVRSFFARSLLVIVHGFLENGLIWKSGHISSDIAALLTFESAFKAAFRLL